MSILIRDIKKYYRYIIYAAKADLQSEVTNAYLDWFWWILEPVCNMLIYYLIFGVVFKNEEQYYLVFIYSGITMWTFFSRTMTVSVRLIQHSKSIITKVYIPKSVLLLEKMLVNAFKMLISWGIVVVLMIPYRIPVDYHLLWLIPILFVFCMFTYGCGCILMHFGVYMDDLSYIISILLNMMFYFNGIFYSVSNKFPQPLGGVLENVNPIAFLIAAMRKALMYRQEISVSGLLLWLVISIVLSVIGTKIIYRHENSYVKVI